MTDGAGGRSGRRKRRKAVAACRKGDHRFGRPQSVGGGITRRICLACGEVSIDLTGAEVPEPAPAEEDPAR